jgi:hypothetical protein
MFPADFGFGANNAELVFRVWKRQKPLKEERDSSKYSYFYILLLGSTLI